MQERDKVKNLSSESKVKNTFKECLESELVIFIVSLMSFVVGFEYVVMWILNVIPLISYPLFIIYYKKRHRMKGPIYLLHNGIFSGCISFIFLLMSISLALGLVQGKTRNIILCVMIAGYAVAVFVFVHVLRKIVAEKDSPKAKKSKVRLASGLGAVFGISIARTLNSIDTKIFIEFLCILCFFASCLTLIGLFNIFKYQDLAEHNESHDEIKP